MGHVLQAVVGPRAEIDALVDRWDGARCVGLAQGFAALPVTDEALDALGAGLDTETAAAVAVAVGGLYRRDPALLDAVAQASRRRPIAYVETDYFGGAGGQAALVARDGRIIGVRAADGVPGRDGPINRALREIGVRAPAGTDEFDALGLGRFRSTDDLLDRAGT